MGSLSVIGNCESTANGTGGEITDMSFASACNLVFFLLRRVLRRGNEAMGQRRRPRRLIEAMGRDHVCLGGFQRSCQALGRSIHVEFVCRIGNDDAVCGKASLEM